MPDTIEAEVLEIDGQRPAPVQPPQGDARSGSKGRSAFDPRGAWGSLGGRVLRLDRRWWPLWVVLGIVAVVVLGVVFCVAAVVFTMVRILGGILRFLIGPGRSVAGGPLIRR